MDARVKGDARGPSPSCTPESGPVCESKALPVAAGGSNVGGLEREREVDAARQSRSTDMRERERLTARQSIPESAL